MSLDPLVKLDAVKVTGSSKTLPVRSLFNLIHTPIQKGWGFFHKGVE